jgi:hypothetical protein
MTLVKNRPVADQDRLVVLWGRTPDGQFDNYPLTLEEARDFTRDAQSFDQSAFFAY